MPGTVEISRRQPALAKELLTLPAVMLYLEDQQKAQTLAQNLFPQCRIDIAPFEYSADIILIPSFGDISGEQLERGIYSLALQLGIAVTLRVCDIDPLIPIEHYSSLQSLYRQFPEIRAIRCEGSGQIGIYVSTPSEHLRSLADDLPGNARLYVGQSPQAVSIQPTVLVEVGERPFSNIYSDLSPLTLARTFLEASVSEINEARTEKVRNQVNDILSEVFQGDYSTTLYANTLLVRIVGDRAISEEKDFYRLTEQIAEVTKGKCAVVIYLSPPSSSSPASRDRDLSDMIEDANSHSLESAKVVVDYRSEIEPFLRQKLGTMVPFAVLNSDDNDQPTLWLSISESGNHEQWEIVNQLIVECPYLKIAQLPSNGLINNRGQRTTISDAEMAGIIGAVEHRLCIDKTMCRWAEVEDSGNLVMIYPKMPITLAFRHAIAERLKLIPAPIFVNSPSQQTEVMTVSELRLMTKLMLPETAVLVNSGKHGKGGDATFTIACPANDQTSIETHLSALYAGLSRQQVRAKVVLLSDSLSDALQRITSRHRKTFVRHCTNSGKIVLEDWQLPQSELALGAQSERESIHAGVTIGRYRNFLVDRQDLKMFSVDVSSASLIEDGLSVEEQPRGHFRVGVHCVNAALLCEPYSKERSRAYDRGNTVYSNTASLASMTERSPGYSFLEHQARPAISVFFDVRRTNQGYELCNDRPSVELTIVKNRKRLSFDVGGKDRFFAPARFTRDFEVIYGVAEHLENSCSVLPKGHREKRVEEYFTERLLTFANHAIAQKLRDAQLPCIYQESEKPTLKTLYSVWNQLAEPVRREIFSGALEDIYTDERQVRAIVKSILRLEKPQLPRKFDFSALGASYTLDGNAPYFIGGQAPYLTANSGARRLVSMIAQHQITALAGVYSPLSIGEIQVLAEFNEDHRTKARQLRHELKLFQKFDMLVKLVAKKSGIEASILRVDRENIIHIRFDERVLSIENGCLDIQAAPANGQTGIIRTRGANRSFRHQQTIRVVPVSYSLIDDKFYFSVVE